MGLLQLSLFLLREHSNEQKNQTKNKQNPSKLLTKIRHQLFACHGGIHFWDEYNYTNVFTPLEAIFISSKSKWSAGKCYSVVIQVK